MWTAKPEISKAEPQINQKLIINQLHTGPQQPSLNSELLTHHSKGLEWDFLVPSSSFSLFQSLGWEYPTFQDLQSGTSQCPSRAVIPGTSHHHPSWNSPPSREREELLQFMANIWIMNKMREKKKTQKIPTMSSDGFCFSHRW